MIQLMSFDDVMPEHAGLAAKRQLIIIQNINL
jgi:hypothetical protein